MTPCTCDRGWWWISLSLLVTCHRQVKGTDPSAIPCLCLLLHPLSARLRGAGGGNGWLSGSQAPETAAATCHHTSVSQKWLREGPLGPVARTRNHSVLAMTEAALQRLHPPRSLLAGGLAHSFPCSSPGTCPSRGPACPGPRGVITGGPGPCP